MPKRKPKHSDSPDPALNHTGEVLAMDAGASSAKQHAIAADIMSDELDLVRKLRQSVGANPKAHGNLFEQIEVAKFNRNAAFAGSRIRAETAAMPSRPKIIADPHAAGDIRILSNSRVVREVQAKCYQDTNSTIHKLSSAKYRGMQRLVPIDKVPDVVENLDGRLSSVKVPRQGSASSIELQDVRKNLSGELASGKLRSGGTKYAEARKLVQNTESSILGYKVEGVVGEAAQASVVAAVVAATIAGTIYLVRHVASNQAAREVSKETLALAGKHAVKAGLKGGAVTATGAVVRTGAREAVKNGMSTGLGALQKANVAGVVAAGMVNCGIVVWNLAQGKCTADEALEEIGQNGVASISGLYFGAASGASLAPLVAGAPALVALLPAAIGSAAGYLVASCVYKACLSILKNARLAEEEAERIEVACAEAICQMRSEQAEFECILNQGLTAQLEAFQRCFAKIDAGLDDDNADTAIDGIADLLHVFGEKLLFPSFQEFDTFMKDSNSKLVF